MKPEVLVLRRELFWTLKEERNAVLEFLATLALCLKVNLPCIPWAGNKGTIKRNGLANKEISTE